MDSFVGLGLFVRRWSANIWGWSATGEGVIVVSVLQLGGLSDAGNGQKVLN